MSSEHSQSVKDALADAAQLRAATPGVTCEPVVDATLLGGIAARKMLRAGDNWLREHLPAEHTARRAASAAFAAVPGLRA